MDPTTFRMMMGAAATKRVGQREWTTPGTYSFVVPMGVTSISAVCIGGGSSGGGSNDTYGGGNGGAGAANRHIRNLSVTPGEVLTVIAGAAGIVAPQYDPNPGVGNASRIQRGATTLLFAGAENSGSPIGTSGGATIGGGNGGAGSGGYSISNNRANGGSGGGAGGYSGAGGSFRSGSTPATGGGGGAGYTSNSSAGLAGNGGGGVGLFGEGASGANGTSAFRDAAGGSGGSFSSGSHGGRYGGGGGGEAFNGIGSFGNPAQDGAVRIIWGVGRAYPSTRTANEYQ